MATSRLGLVLATWGGCGYFPGAPGTAGSVAAVLAGYVLVHQAGLSPWWLGALAAALLWPACWASDVAADHFSREDPPQVVVDEVAGQWIVLSAVAPDNWLHWLAAFVLFRLLDIFKPYPIRRLERLPKGIGVVADDVGAGLCGMIILVVLRWVLES
jgi:phosphatidylglycerophosphatase A